MKVPEHVSAVGVSVKHAIRREVRYGVACDDLHARGMQNNTKKRIGPTSERTCLVTRVDRVGGRQGSDRPLKLHANPRHTG
jgi:hypothetical protein